MWYYDNDVAAGFTGRCDPPGVCTGLHRTVRDAAAFRGQSMTDMDRIPDIASYHQFATKSKTAESYFQSYDVYNKIPEVLGFQHKLVEHASYLLGFKYKDEKAFTAKSEPCKIRINLEFPMMFPTSFAYISYAKTFFRLWGIHKSVLSGIPYVNHVFRAVVESLMGQYYIACCPGEFRDKFGGFEKCCKARCGEDPEDRPSPETMQKCHHRHLEMRSVELSKALYKDPSAIKRIHADWSNEEVHFNPRVWRDEDPDEALQNMWAFLCFSVHNVVSFVESYKVIQSEDTIKRIAGPFMDRFGHVLKDVEINLIPDKPEHRFLWDL